MDSPPDTVREAAIDQLCSITATDTTMGRRSIEHVLRSTDWNVEQAADLIFSNPEALRQSNAFSPPEPTPAASRSESNPRQNRRQGPPIGARVGISPLNVLTWPIRFVLRLISGLWYLLVRNVLPLGLLPYMPRFLLPPSGASSGYSQSLPLTSRRSFAETLRQECPDGYIPDFWGRSEEEDEGRPKGTYKEFLNHLKAERKVGCVVLCCADHEDDLDFKRNVLTNEEFVKCLRENEISLWAADIREKEGYQISQTLQTTTYPAVSFFSLMPVGPSSSSSSNSKFTILTTVQGPPSTITSAPSLIQLITNTIVPRTRPFLNRLKRERQALEEARRVREEQDRILAETERRDRDKILKIRRENQERATRDREDAERQRHEQETHRLTVERRAKFRENMQIWRAYAKQHLLPAEPSAEDVKAKKAIRVQIRLPQGIGAARNVRIFPVDLETSRDVYIWAETLLLGDDDVAPRLPPGFSTDYPPQTDEPHLTLYTSYPRKQVSFDAQGWKEVQDAGGSLVLELAAGEQDVNGVESDDESD